MFYGAIFRNEKRLIIIRTKKIVAAKIKLHLCYNKKLKKMTPKLSKSNLCYTVIVALGLLFSSNLHSQNYCSPTFPLGCSLWNTKSVTLYNLNWFLGANNCMTSDYTADTAFLAAGNTYPMMVTNGDWCGCGVWIDFNNDNAFDSTENMYHMYIASQSATHSFNLIIPANVSTGSYRMRVIAGWGTDTYNVSANGYGPCGAYQYGNFNDFTVHVANPLAITNNTNNNSPALSAQFIAETNDLEITISNLGFDKAILQLCDVNGNVLQSMTVTQSKVIMNLSAQPKGLYFLQLIDGGNLKSIKVLK